MNKINFAEMENSGVKSNSETAASPLVTLPQWPFAWPSLSAMRAYVHRAEELGLSEAFVRVGRRVLVDPQRFFSLIRNLEKQPSKRGKLNENDTGAVASHPKGNN